MINKELERIKPVTASVAQEAVCDFIKNLKDYGVVMHGFMMLRDGKVFAEGYYKPYEKSMPHRMYSISKSITSLAIGFLIEDKVISINDYITEYFPEKLPDKVPVYIQEMKIKHLLTMATAHSTTAYKQYGNDDWVEAFFKLEPTHYPGTVFSYDTSASHTLGALVEKLTGKALYDYMWKRVFSKLHFSKDSTKWLLDPKEICMGGSGFICTMEDLAKLAYTIMNDGIYDGNQILPKSYIREATAFHIDTSIMPNIEEQYGYGYQFWRTRNDGYAMYGMGGQYAICLPKYNFILLTTADTQKNPSGNSIIFQSLWKYIYPELEKTTNHHTPQNLTCPANNNTDMLQPEKPYEQAFQIAANNGQKEAECLKTINNVIYRMDKNPMGVTYIKLSVHNDAGVFYYGNEEGEHSLEFGIGGFKNQLFPELKYVCYTSGGFGSENAFHIVSHIIDDDIGSLHINIGFNNSYATVSIRNTFERRLNSKWPQILIMQSAIVTGKQTSWGL